MSVGYERLFIRQFEFEFLTKELFNVCLYVHTVLLAADYSDEKIIGVAHISHASEILVHVQSRRVFLHFAVKFNNLTT